MGKTVIQAKVPQRLIRASRYVLDQIKVSLPNETKRNNGETEFCLVVAGAHKVGSTWVYKMIRDLHAFREWPVPSEFRSNRKNLGLIGLQIPGVDGYFSKTKGFRLYKSHSEPPHWDLGSKVKFVTVIRDPRDIVISATFYLANLAPELGGWAELKTLPLAERIRRYLKRGVFDLELLEKWSEYPNATKIYYERLLESPEIVMQQLFIDLGLKVSNEECRRIVQNNSFDRLSGGRRTGQEDQASFFRKGVAGDWRNYFGEQEMEAFKTENDGCWNKLLLRLGYEATEHWG